MSQSIKVRITKVYGNDTVYPVCEIAKSLAALAGHKTFTKRDLDLIQNDLGYVISVEQQTL